MKYGLLTSAAKKTAITSPHQASPDSDIGFTHIRLRILCTLHNSSLHQSLLTFIADLVTISTPQINHHEAEHFVPIMQQLLKWDHKRILESPMTSIDADACCCPCVFMHSTPLTTQSGTTLELRECFCGLEI